MEYVLTVAQDRRIAYALRRSTRARLIRVTVYHDGRVMITVPRRLGAHQAERFVRQKALWILAKIAAFKAQKPRLLPGGACNYARYKTSALEFVCARLAFFNAHYRLAYSRVTVRNQRTRWGSCSKRKSLSFNWRIVFLPQALQDYLIVHELCHVRTLNHAAHFWALVGEKIPDYKALRKELKNAY